ncbi:MAG: General stress protein 18 [Candidatus Anoxychlamydiales bacterium]|nr:General stress protein 18 [Candidatus Anoxychlamydiales bacterium]
MAKIAVLLEDLFEDSEFLKPFEAFKEKGHDVVVIGTKIKTVTGMKKYTKVEIEKEIKDVKEKDFDALFIPGGYSPDKLRIYDEVLAFVKDFMKEEKPVFAICHGSQILISADVLKNRKVTGWKSIKQDLINAKATFIDDKVVVDKNLISSRMPDDLPYFIEECLKKLNEL